jgi:chromosome segregation ATPase
MSKANQLDALRARRVELEDESQFLKETKKNMEYRVNILEEKIAIKELEHNNEVTQEAVAQLKSKKKTLTGRLKQIPQEQTSPPEEELSHEAHAQPAPNKKTPTTATAEFQGNIVIDETMANESEIENEAHLKKKPAKKHKFF